MRNQIRSTVGTDGAVDLSLVTDMEHGRSRLRVNVAVDFSTDTNCLQSIQSKWDRITALRYEFQKRLAEVIGDHE